MSHADTQIRPVPVLVTNLPQMPGPNKKKRRAVLPRTIVLTAASPVKVLLSQDTSRKIAWVIATGNPVVLCESQSQAEDPANSVATLPNPEGFLLPTGIKFPLDTTELMWVTAQAFPALVSLLIINDGPEY